jgi:uncharacterized protein YwbE
MHTEMRGPKEHIVDTRDRFMDFVGNALNGVLGDFDNFSDESLSAEAKARAKEHLKTLWPRFFETIDIFLQTDFEPTGKLTREGLEKILEHRNDDPLADGVIDEVDRLYRSTVGLEEQSS